MLFRFSCPSAPEETFKGIIDLVEMKADVYYDELGNDMTVEEIPGRYEGAGGEIPR